MTNEARRERLLERIREAINFSGYDNALAAPDFVLAEHCVRSLEALCATKSATEKFFGKAVRIGGVVEVKR